MEFDNSFEVPLPIDAAWKILMDIRRIAPCMPGAELTDVVDDRTYKGKIGVRLGPVALTFAGTVKFEEVDDANRTARVAAQGTTADSGCAGNCARRLSAVIAEAITAAEEFGEVAFPPVGGTASDVSGGAPRGQDRAMLRVNISRRH